MQIMTGAGGNEEALVTLVQRDLGGGIDGEDVEVPAGDVTVYVRPGGARCARGRAALRVRSQQVDAEVLRSPREAAERARGVLCDAYNSRVAWRLGRSVSVKSDSQCR